MAHKSTTKEKATITQGEYIDRLRVVQVALEGMNYKTLYEYEFEKLTDELSTRLVNFWNFRCNDIEFLERFEQIASNIKNS